MVREIIEKCQTKDPFQIADYLGIVILSENLGSINGFYNSVYNQKFIHVNLNLPYQRQYYVFFHELGHAILHPDHNIHFMKGNCEELEVEADCFALSFLLLGKENIDAWQVSKYYGIPYCTVEKYIKTR